METIEMVRERGIRQGGLAAQFDAEFGTDEAMHAQATRRKQGERSPNVWAEAFITGYEAYLSAAKKNAEYVARKEAGAF